MASGLILLWVQVPLEMPPSWGFPHAAGPCRVVFLFFFFSSDESDMTCTHFFFLDMTHFLEAQVLFSTSIHVEFDQELHVEHVDSLEQEEHLMNLL